MCFNAARLFLAGFLIAVFAFSLLPQSASAWSPQTGSSAPRRGKNGTSSESQSSKKDDTAQGATGKTLDSNSDKQPTSSTSNTQAPRRTTNSARQTSQTAQQPSQSASSQKTSPAKPSPPPFDRPPMNTDDQASSQSGDPSGGRTGSSQQTTGRTSTGKNGSGRDRNARIDTSTARDAQQDDPPDSTERRSSKQQPELGRPTDTRNGSYTQDGAKQKPVLRHPGDADPDPSGGSQSGQQTAKSTGSDDDQVVRLESTLVNIPLLVSDRAGRYIPQLSKKDFLLYEDGAQQEIASFGSEEVPFNVALLLDVSPSVAGSVRDIQDAALSFVRQLRDRDRVMVVSFDRRAHFLTDLTSDRRELEYAIRSITTGSGTSVYDVVYEVVARRLRTVEGRKALILFSDGEDTTSNRASYEDAIDVVSESDVLVYGLRYPGTGGGNIRVSPWPQRMPVPQMPIPLPFPWPRNPAPRRPRGPLTGPDPNGSGGGTTQSWPRRHGGDFMADIAAAGGGPVYDAQVVSDLSTLAARIAEELRHVYVLSYYPSKPFSAGGYRSIRISVKGRDDIAVRHRRGYNAGGTSGSTTTTH